MLSQQHSWQKPKKTLNETLTNKLKMLDDIEKIHCLSCLMLFYRRIKTTSTLISLRHSKVDPQFLTKIFHRWLDYYFVKPSDYLYFPFTVNGASMILRGIFQSDKGIRNATFWVIIEGHDGCCRLFAVV